MSNSRKESNAAVFRQSSYYYSRVYIAIGAMQILYHLILLSLKVWNSRDLKRDILVNCILFLDYLLHVQFHVCSFV